MQDDVAECIKKDYVAVVGTSEYFPIWTASTSFPFIFTRSAVSAGLRNLEGALVISGGGQVAQVPNAQNMELGQRIMDEGGQIWNRNRDYGNKMMFAAQGIRGLRLNSGGADYKTLIYFTAGYNSAQRAAIEAAGAEHASPGRTFAISNTNELIAKLNEAAFPNDKCSRRILRMDMYSHGIPDDLAFGYGGRNASVRSFTAAHATRLNRERFEIHGSAGSIYSWACRSAISDGGTHGGLAQAIANATGATVYAFSRRTEYTNTWNTGTQSATGLIEISGDGSLVVWHPDGARGGVVGGTSPSENPAGQFRFVPQ